MSKNKISHLRLGKEDIKSLHLAVYPIAKGDSAVLGMACQVYVNESSKTGRVFTTLFKGSIKRNDLKSIEGAVNSFATEIRHYFSDALENGIDAKLEVME